MLCLNGLIDRPVKEMIRLRSTGMINRRCANRIKVTMCGSRRVGEKSISFLGGELNGS